MEPAGIEPASERSFPGDPTCVVTRVRSPVAARGHTAHGSASVHLAPRRRGATGGPARFIYARTGATGRALDPNAPGDFLRSSGGRGDEVVVRSYVSVPFLPASTVAGHASQGSEPPSKPIGPSCQSCPRAPRGGESTHHRPADRRVKARLPRLTSCGRRRGAPPRRRAPRPRRARARGAHRARRAGRTGARRAARDRGSASPRDTARAAAPWRR
jgi:hypothetical protein